MGNEEKIIVPEENNIPGTIAAETGTVSDEASQQTARDYLLGRLSERHPDDDFSDDERFYDRLREDIDGYEGTINEHSEKEKQLASIFNSDPRSAQFLMEWAKGDDPVLLLIRTYGDDFRAALDDPENLEKFTEARNEYLKKQTGHSNS